MSALPCLDCVPSVHYTLLIRQENLKCMRSRPVPPHAGPESIGFPTQAPPKYARKPTIPFIFISMPFISVSPHAQHSTSQAHLEHSDPTTYLVSSRPLKGLIVERSDGFR